MSTEFYPLTISKVQRLTKQAVALEFEVPEKLRQKFSYKQGQHLTLKADIDGHDIRRSYSICKGLDRNQQASNYLTVGIKQIAQGVFSDFANHKLEAGMTLEVMPPQGHFFCNLDKDSKKHYCLIAVGSGITPMLSHIETIFAVEPQAQITLLYGNKRTPLMMFKDKLNFIKNEQMDRFQWVNFFTDEENEAEILNGRISAQKIIDLNAAKIIQIEAFDEVFICGPEEMTLAIANAFEFWGFDSARIHYELFFSGTVEKQAEAKQAKRSQKFGEKISQVSVKVSGRTISLDLEMGGLNILDAAMEHGADLPYSCKGGVCATCKARVTKGKVEMDVNHSLTPEEVEDGMILTCQAHPITDQVEVDYDFS
jgi:ring-1,2-phenylacetyl-CoA epoxidase subunit PaaE